MRCSLANLTKIINESCFFFEKKIMTELLYFVPAFQNLQ